MTLASRRRSLACTLVTAAVLAGCSAPAPAAKPARAEAVSPVVVGPREPDAAPSSPSPAAAPVTPPAVEAGAERPCAQPDLAITVAGFDVALGSRYLLLAAENTSTTPCVLGGRPELAFVRQSGTLAPDVTLVRRLTNPRPDGPALLAPGAAAYSELRWGAMSTSQDPDVTVTVRVQAVPGAHAVAVPIAPPPLPDAPDEPPTWIDVLAGAEVEVGPWQTTIEGWGV